MTGNGEARVRLNAAKDTCETCRFWKPQEFSGGLCHRFPPTPFWQAAFDGCGTSEGGNLRPYTEHNEWCGEWTFAGKLHEHGAGRRALENSHDK